MIFGVEAALHQPLREFERHSGSAKLLVRILATFLVRIDDGQRIGNAVGTGQVMVGHDEINAESLRRFGRRECANAHVNADDQANAGRGRAFDHVIAHVVALANTVGDVEVRRSATELDRSLQDDDRHGAVDVVVAIDQDGFFAFNGGIETIDSGAQAGHLFWRVKMGNGRHQKMLCSIQVGDSTTDQQRSEDMSCICNRRTAEGCTRTQRCG